MVSKMGRLLRMRHLGKCNDNGGNRDAFSSDVGTSLSREMVAPQCGR